MSVIVFSLQAMNPYGGLEDKKSSDSKKNMEQSVAIDEKKTVVLPTEKDWWVIWDLQMACAGRYVGESPLLPEFESQVTALKCLNEEQKGDLKKKIQEYDEAVAANNDFCDSSNQVVLKTRAALLQYRFPSGRIESVINAKKDSI